MSVARIRRLMWVSTFVAALAVTLVLAACGTTPTNGNAAGNAATSTATTGGKPVSSVPPTTPPTNSVTLTIDHAAYTPSSSIVVTLVNHRSTSIFSFDHQTSCTILTLQRQTANGWENVGNCAMGRLTRQIEIAAGDKMQVTLAPGAGQLKPTPWPAGTCRVILHYALAGQDAASNSVTTATFTIQ